MKEPLRILQIVTHMNRGGLETMLMNYYREIDRTQIQFDFLVHRQTRGDYDDEIEALGGRIYRMPRLNPWNPHYITSLQRFFREHTYEIVHCHLDCMSAVPLDAARKAGVPIRIAHSHNSNQDHNLKYLVKLWYRGRIPATATALFACSKAAGDWMFCGKSYQLFPNAIPAKAYRFCEETREDIRTKLHIPDHQLIVGNVARFSPQKNHSFLLDIFEKISLKTDAVLLLVGDGELRQNIEAKVHALQLDGKVRFVGKSSHVEQLLQAFDVFAMPSLYEGLPLTLIEAQASGLPCIISDRVPLECKITDLVAQVSLESSAEDWSETILTAAKLPRRQTLPEIQSAGYDIELEARKLTDYYRRCVQAATVSESLGII